MATQRLSHPEFKRCSRQEATAFAWAFQSANSSPVEYPFKIPAPEQDEVTIRVTYGGICHTDKCIQAKLWGFGYYPCVMGHQIVGRVQRVGAKSTNFKVGDLVGVGFNFRACQKCEYCVTGQHNLCSGVKRNVANSFGGFATHINVQSALVIPVPLSLDESKVGPLLCAGVTAYAPIETHCKPGESTAVIGIGGVGHLAVMFGAAMGLQVTAFSTTPDKEKEALSLGAHNFVAAQTNQELAQFAQTFDNVIFAASTSTQEALLPYVNLVRQGGQFIMLGVPEADQELGIPFMNLIFNQIQLIGSAIGNTPQFYRMLDLCSQQQILPLCEQFSYQDFHQAYDYSCNGQPKYRVVLNFGQFFDQWKASK